MPGAIEEIAALLRAGIAEIEQEEEKLRKALTDLDGGAARKPRAPAAAPKRRRARK